MLTYDHYSTNIECKCIGNRTPSLLSSIGASAESEHRGISFYKLRQSPGSCLGLENMACVTTPVAPACFWSNNHVVLKVLRSLHKPAEVIPQVTSDPARWPGKQLCGHVWMNHHVRPGTLIFPTATARFLSHFFPAARWDGFPSLYHC